MYDAGEICTYEVAAAVVLVQHFALDVKVALGDFIDVHTRWIALGRTARRETCSPPCEHLCTHGETGFASFLDPK